MLGWLSKSLILLRMRDAARLTLHHILCRATSYMCACLKSIATSQAAELECAVDADVEDVVLVVEVDLRDPDVLVQHLADSDCVQDVQVEAAVVQEVPALRVEEGFEEDVKRITGVALHWLSKWKQVFRARLPAS